MNKFSRIFDKYSEWMWMVPSNLTNLTPWCRQHKHSHWNSLGYWFIPHLTIVESNYLLPFNPEMKLAIRVFPCNIFVTLNDFTDHNFNMEIRVGEDGQYLGNNKICLELIDFRDSVVANITCLQALFGDWISINKSSSNTRAENLYFQEVHVFGSKFIKMISSYCSTRTLYKKNISGTWLTITIFSLTIINQKLDVVL